MASLSLSSIHSSILSLPPLLHSFLLLVLQWRPISACLLSVAEWPVLRSLVKSPGIIPIWAERRARRHCMMLESITKRSSRLLLDTAMAIPQAGRGLNYLLYFHASFKVFWTQSSLRSWLNRNSCLQCEQQLLNWFLCSVLGKTAHRRRWRQLHFSSWLWKDGAWLPRQ